MDRSSGATVQASQTSCRGLWQRTRGVSVSPDPGDAYRHGSNCPVSSYIFALTTGSIATFIKGKHTPCFLLSLLTQLEVPDLLRE